MSAFVEGSWVRIDSKGPNEAAYEDGFGDTRAILRYTFTVVPHEHVEGEANGPLGFHWGVGKLALGAGVSLPTGEPGRIESSPGPVSQASLQRGTGTFDPLFTAVFSQGVDKGSLFAGAAVRLPGGESRFDYRVGEAVQVNLGAVVPVSDSFDVVPKVSYLYNAPDEFQGRDAFASGGHWVSLVPGVRWRATEHVDVEASVEIPVFRDLRTEALDAPARLALGISYKF
ncbi:MAG: hypothetical protein HYR85_23005 [Planctomycetes bacterium]|nr:hypothetical protein [Planctomycetota bacterium]MBI3843357.1 hypothetical protein [Planctomycetota bacterium]